MLALEFKVMEHLYELESGEEVLLEITSEF